MSSLIRLRRAAAGIAAVTVIAFGGPVMAQEIAASHLAAAHAALDAINATDAYDGILPQAATAMKANLIQQNPDLEGLISATVDEQTILIAGRRADLEKEAALVYARLFTEAELTAISQFYGSEAGKKLLEQGPNAAREISRAAQIWQNGISRDLAKAVGEQLSKTVSVKAAAPEAGGTEAPKP